MHLWIRTPPLFRTDLEAWELPVFQAGCHRQECPFPLAFVGPTAASASDHFFPHLIFESLKQQRQDLGGEQRLTQAAADGRMNRGGASQESDDSDAIVSPNPRHI